MPAMLKRIVILALAAVARAGTLHVGPGQSFDRPEAALGAAHPGDTILIHPLDHNAPYPRVALLIRTPRLTIRSAGDEPIPLSGSGFDYSGEGRTPRAILQVDPAADHCTIAGFDLSGARNGSHNGAGVRINQADHCTIRSCVIHDNDMGVMSSGGPDGRCTDQRIENCLIRGNGSPTEPGYSHNLYLGGESVVLSACEIHSSTAGHNVKSRAHYTRLEYCFIHDSANREIDLVDARGVTDGPGSDAVLLGCIVTKSPTCTGNRAVIHFGQDGGGEHTGTLYVVNCTFATPFIAPVVTLSAPGAHAVIDNCIFDSAGSSQHHQMLADPFIADRISGRSNAAAPGFERDARLGLIIGDPSGVRGVPVRSLTLPPAPGRDDDHPGLPLLQYKRPPSSSARPDSDAPQLGARSIP